GFEVVSELREAKNYVLVLILTARGRPEDVLQGFASGADDYVAKPFELPIFLARLQGLLRRRAWMQQAPAGQHSPQPPDQSSDSSGQEFGTFAFSGRTIDFGNLELRTNGTTTHLTVMEAELLRYLIRHRGQVVSRKSILEE